ncbi:MAG: DNA mismatch repair protein MutS [Vicinamibacteria bacterium]
MKVDPQSAYVSRAQARRSEMATLEAQDARLSLARGGVALVALGAFIVMGFRPIAVFGFALAALTFVILIILHERLALRLARAKGRVAFYETALARSQGQWIGRGDTGARFLDASHPNAIDLDLFGRGSIFERLSTARTHAGQDRLASWLQHPCSIAEIRERQRSVTEMGPRLDLREDLAVLGAEARRGIDSAALMQWAQGQPVVPSQTLRIAAIVASTAFFISLAGWGLDLWGAIPFRFAFLAVLVCVWKGRAFAHQVLEGIGRPVKDLQALTELFDRLVVERFESPRLVQLHGALTASGESPSKPIEKLRRWMEIHESKSNVFFGLLSFFIAWDLHLSIAVEAWRRRHGAAIVGWIASLGEIEAVVSLGAYAFENPVDPFPTLVEGGPRFEGQGLGHPLLPIERAIRNDLRLDGALQMLVITGSNMSGKSTFLRTVGTNTVLALAGAPVRATALTLSPMIIGASIRIQDSLQDGESRFYAEIKRVRQILDVARGPLPALFLMDEIFDGTNSAERRVGAEAVVRSLVERGAIGLVTSHDLALAEIAVSLAPRAMNVHFEDHLEGDRMAFDYRIKPGPVQRGNALGLMRAVGLEV